MMKSSKLRMSVMAGCMLLACAFTANEALAQRPSRGHSGGRPSVGGGSSHGTSRPNVRPPSRPSGPSHGHIVRPSYGYRPGYRPHYRPYYRYYNFYRPYLGISLRILPFGYYPFYYGPDQFYYSGGLFYKQYNDVYTVVVPPVGAQVPSIPSDAKEVVINGQSFYEYKGVYYSLSKDANGKTVYTVAGKDGVLNTDGKDDYDNIDGDTLKIGTIVKQLPDNYREVFIKGEKYYISEEGVYYEEVVEGNNVTYKVVGIGN